MPVTPAASKSGEQPTSTPNESSRPPVADDLLTGTDTRDLAKFRQRSLLGPGAVAYVRARPVDLSRALPVSEFVSIGRRFLGLKDPLAASFLAVRRMPALVMSACVIEQARWRTKLSR